MGDEEGNYPKTLLSLLNGARKASREGLVRKISRTPKLA
jgi:hypothetical protein